MPGGLQHSVLNNTALLGQPVNVARMWLRSFFLKFHGTAIAVCSNITIERGNKYKPVMFTCLLFT